MVLIYLTLSNIFNNERTKDYTYRLNSAQPLMHFVPGSLEPISFCSVSLRSVRGSKSGNLSELVERKFEDLEVFLSSVERVDFLVIY